MSAKPCFTCASCGETFTATKGPNGEWFAVHGYHFAMPGYREDPKYCPECGGSRIVRLISHVTGYPVGAPGVCGNAFHNM
jgi:hypothetical protein